MENSLVLSELGWTEHFEQELSERFGPSYLPARVVRTSKGLHLLRTASGEGLARTTGSFAYHTASPADMPTVGDWVAARRVDDPEAPLRIEGVLSRTSAITRKQAGSESLEQVLAANVDIGCIVFSLEGGRKCSPRAAERYVTMVWGSGAVPLILLNKSDISSDPDRSVVEIESVAPGVEVLALSCVRSVGIDAVRSRLPRGKTAVLLGPSGTGKSTLINLLTGEEGRTVGEVRDGDKKGRHTTTHRELVSLPGGALIIDTPGLRELQLWADSEDLDDAFSDVAALAPACRFRDCTHTGEPGCAVQAALAEGAIPHERFAAYLELKREIAYLERRSDDRLRREERGRWKKINREMRGFTKERRSRGLPDRE